MQGLTLYCPQDPASKTEMVMKHSHENTEYTGKPVHGHVASTGGMKQRQASAYWPGIKRFFAMLDNNLWLFSGMAVGLAALIIIWWSVFGHGPDGTRPDPDARYEQPRSDTAGGQAIDQVTDQLTGLNERVEMLTESITHLESKLVRAHVLADSIINTEQRQVSSIPAEQSVIDKTVEVGENLPPPGAGPKGGVASNAETSRPVSAELTPAPREMTVIDAAISTTEKTRLQQSDRLIPGPQAPGTGTSSQGAATVAAVTEPRLTASNKQPVKQPAEGPWVINLASSPSQADAERFAAKARSRGIETRQQQVSVKGKHYWRVQTTGFSTAAEAQTYAGTVRETLGLKDVWITTR